jgi:hypothetical protein
MPERLRQKIDGSGLHRLNGHWDVAMTRHENYRDVDARRGQIGLKVEATDARQPDIEH